MIWGKCLFSSCLIIAHRAVIGNPNRAIRPGAALALAVRCTRMEILAIFSISPYNVPSKNAVEK
jgi:hypothetical protein